MSNKLWFTAKRYGWGWTPATIEGWAVIIFYAVFLVWMFRGIDLQSHSGSDTLISFFLPFVISTTILIFICYKKGEKPRWRWGKD